tara:strand:+ start:2684 stop:3607 length:924 start_codon:yes stop_codon:yes gene_type:complete
MRVLIMGAGGVGGYLGARLASQGMDVGFVARGAHLAAMRRRGLILRGVEPLTLMDVHCDDNPRAWGPADVVLFCVKLYDTASAVAALAPAVASDTIIITLQNGINSVADLQALLPATHVMGGAAYFPANITAPGEVTYLGKIASKPHFAFGDMGTGVSSRAQTIAEAFNAAGLEVQVSDDTERMLWEKFLLIAGTSAATALTRQPMGPVRMDDDMRWLLREAIQETRNVALASGVTLADTVVDDVMDTLAGNPADGKSSQLVDLENGRRLELLGLSGAVVERGQTLGIETPVHRTVLAALKPFIDGA